MPSSQPLALTAARMFTPLETIADAVVLIRDGTIQAAGPRAAVAIPPGAQVVDYGQHVLAPGLMDLHIHGGAGHDVMEGDPAALAAVETLIARHGVSSYYPTTVTAPLDATLASLEKLGRAVLRAAQADDHSDAGGPPRARPLGIHLEGPFISHARRGVHPPENIIAPSPALLERFWQASQGQLRIVTIAPEAPDALATIAAAQALGIRASLGHSDADLPTAQAAIEAGARQATHTFNAMPPLDHRVPNLLTAVLSDARVRTEVIADGIHVHPMVLEMFLRLKGPERVLLITDATAATGMPDGDYRLGPLLVQVRGQCCMYEGKLAGSVLTLDRAVRNVMQFAGWPLHQALRLATLNPAQALGQEGRGRLQPGAAADVVVLTSQGEVVETIVAGRRA